MTGVGWGEEVGGFGFGCEGEGLVGKPGESAGFEVVEEGIEVGMGFGGGFEGMMTGKD